MKYWTGKPGTKKEGQYGTMNDSGNVPDSIKISKIEYDNYIKTIPKITIEDSDIKKIIKYAKEEGWI